ncbi:NADP-dependent malic enzyme [Sporosarcina pasteurii]|uniref:NADP-dependent malic enzyme n=1 Tax=Sporosarcina pasteurii TaxID=1474 RepID=A0A380C470_SPOPA|nr:malic enzyme-like NAD(P)-binding protein [Sporosarcina pasteurii]MDS9471620.1 malic enzyme-like NAD(P)-binding protein [Sporosarcina pasteurii]QBQ04770.1 NAD-dependent malic enzyme [Sporosarcina pasteurii]SUJ11416.1 NADP-dependent malic enzyme [Sporosarcina pasteurii]
MTKVVETALDLHRNNSGKMEILSKVPMENTIDLSLAYSPGVADPCFEIAKDVSRVYEYTIKGNLVAVVTDGSAVLGLGDIGPEASLPVMEGKALLLKKFANIDAFPICLDTKDSDEIVRTVKAMSPTFGGINLEDISAPRCFEIEKRLREECDIPVFHDDQHGTAIVVGAGLLNALRLTNKRIDEVKIVVNGAGAAGVAIIKHLIEMGFQHIVVCDSKGVIYEGRREGMNSVKEEIAKLTNENRIIGSIQDALKEADIFVGVSVANLITEEMVKSMNDESILFALANPVPEISPERAKKFGARVIATGRSDYPNQVNNVLAFPGIFRGALDVRASDINEQMKLAATYALASLIEREELTADYIIPAPFDSRITKAVATAVSKAAKETGVHRID